MSLRSLDLERDRCKRLGLDSKTTNLLIEDKRQQILQYISEEKAKEAKQAQDRKPKLTYEHRPFLAKLTPAFLDNCVHEAGHAVVGHTIGIPILSMQVGNDMAVTEFAPTQLAQDDSRFITVLASGWVAEKMAGRTNEGFDAEHYLVDNRAFFKERKRMGLDAKQSSQLFRRCCYAAEDILQRKWDLLQRLTQQLINARGDALNQHEIRRAIRQ
jgi:hypothetical protein